MTDSDVSHCRLPGGTVSEISVDTGPQIALVLGDAIRCTGTADADSRRCPLRCEWPGTPGLVAASGMTFLPCRSMFRVLSSGAETSGDC